VLPERSVPAKLLFAKAREAGYYLTAGRESHKGKMRMNISHSLVAVGHRALVLSLPKSGTYFVAELLKAIGYRSTDMHLAESAFSNYKGADLAEARQNPGLFARNEPLGESLTRIRPGEFAVGHLPCKAEIATATTSFKRLYLTRDLRTALISYMRFLQSTGRFGAAQLSWYSMADPRQRVVNFLATTAPLLLKRLYAGMAGWRHVEGILHVRFEDLMCDEQRALGVVESIATFLDVAKCDPRRALRSSFAAETITRSDGLTQLDAYWSPDAERQFASIGGPELNARLGCVQSEQSRDLPGPPSNNRRAA
jgi:Sulfotransferase domain